MKMHTWMHELFLPFWYCSFFKRECIYECIKLAFFCFIIFEECIYECMWIFWIKIHAWMHEFFLFLILLFFLKNAFMNAWNFINFLNENVCLNAWIFSFSWMIMHILKHEILFFIFIFLNDNAWNSIFLYVQIFKWFYKWWFFSVNFSKTCFKKICTNFPKEKICTKDIFIDFQIFESLCTKEYFLMISSNVYSKCLYKDFSKYIYFMYIQKGFFQWFFFV